MSRLIKDLIDIPEFVHKADFVLKLNDVVTGSARKEAVASYVVTPQIVRAFDQALTLIQASVTERSSKGSYLHGSFGSGKSHFMAILYLLLQSEPEVLAKHELASVVKKHAWIHGKKFLLVPYHLIGADSLEQALFTQYVAHVDRLHPGAPRPAVYLDEGLLQDADRTRQEVGDEVFFRRLGPESTDTGASGWGGLAATSGFGPASYALARSAPPGDPERARLVTALVRTWFESYGSLAAASGSFVPIDSGLAALSQHARSLGYDGLILFLDEMVLWLASRAGDTVFLNREGPKVAKLVEAQSTDRPTPMVSFIARQQDLRKLVGEHVPGAEKLGFADSLSWWDGRFDTITLEDRNLPVIAEKRILRPKSDGARRELDAAFEQATRMKADTLEILQTTDADRTLFRKVYPFSPALVQALVAVSGALQRERTALKVMVELLKRRRNDLVVGDLIPVGDLWDVIVDGDEPFNDVMRDQFQHAKDLWNHKLLPLLEREHGVSADGILDGTVSGPEVTRFHNDGRLLKTLLLAALVPQVDALKALTASRLAALNHGSIASPIPGQEAQNALMKVRRWAAEVPAIHIGDDGVNPTLSVQLTGVDTQVLIESVKETDSYGQRVNLVRRLFYRELQIAPGSDQAIVAQPFPWRGTKRIVDILFGNIRRLSDADLKATDDRWRLVIDYPLDEEGHGPEEDLQRLDAFRDQHSATRTVAWVPAFFSSRTLVDLGKLVRIEYLLRGERLEQHAQHLSSQDRFQAKIQLENQGKELERRIIDALRAAYGTGLRHPGVLDDTAHDVADCFQSLGPLTPQRPNAARMEDALKHLLDQMLTAQFPEHPHFGTDVTVGKLEKVMSEVERAVQDPNQRCLVPRDLRPLMKDVAEKLELGEMHEEPFLLGRRWEQRFDRLAAEAGGEITMGALRRWTDEPQARGLLAPVQNLLALVYALQSNRTFQRHGGPITATIANIPDDAVLVTAALPSPTEWAEARRRAAALFGLATSERLTAANATRLAADVTKRTSELRPDVRALSERLPALLKVLGIDPETARRYVTARDTARLFDEIVRSDRTIDVLRTLATRTLASPPEAMGTGAASARAVLAVLGDTSLEPFRHLQPITGRPGVDALMLDVREAMTHDEATVPLVARLTSATRDALLILGEQARQSASFGPSQERDAVAPVVSPPSVAARPAGRHVVASNAGEALDRAAAERELDRIRDALGDSPNRRLTVHWTVDDTDRTAS